MKIQIKSKKIILALGTIIFILMIVIAIQFSTVSHRHYKQITRLFTEIENYNNQNLVFEDDIRLINSSTNEVRRLLSLSENKLSLSASDNAIEISQKSDDNLPFYNAVDYILIHSDKTRMEIDFYNLINSDDIQALLSARNLDPAKTGSSSYKLTKSSNIYFTLRIDDSKNPAVTIKSIMDHEETLLLSEINRNISLMFTFIDNEFSVVDLHYEKYNHLKKQLVKLAADRSLNNYLTSEKLEISDLKEENTYYYYIISNKDLTFSIKASLDKLSLKFLIADRKFTEYSEFYSALRKILEDSDKRTDEIRLVDLSKLKIESILADAAFKAYLTQNNITVKRTPREDNDYFYYDITDKDNIPIGSFAVQKIIGDIYLMDSEDIMISSLKYIGYHDQADESLRMDIPENLPLIVDKYSNNNNTTFVVVGSHENNADTIILVHADGNTDKMTLIAIPRDLYYQERKINDYYRSYGGDKFIEILSDITGLSIAGYIAVDMYAFIDLINILGGIDIYLESDLIDPTYTVRDNGEWSTLYYKKGMHHLNGIESLRIVRSRHTSSDFGRTSRQQLVIQGIKDKMTGLDITDLGTVLKLFQTMKNYLDTNISAMEMLGLFMKYKDTEVNRKQGLSTFNVLYNTYTNIYKLKDKSKQYEDNFYRGYWILLPRKDDWNVIKWYIRSLIEDNQV